VVEHAAAFLHVALQSHFPYSLDDGGLSLAKRTHRRNDLEQLSKKKRYIQKRDQEERIEKGFPEPL
jgi:hypothetical protein